jgi:hypothetical protein
MFVATAVYRCRRSGETWRSKVFDPGKCAAGRWPCLDWKCVATYIQKGIVWTRTCVYLRWLIWYTIYCCNKSKYIYINMCVLYICNYRYNHQISTWISTHTSIYYHLLQYLEVPVFPLHSRHRTAWHRGPSAEALRAVQEEAGHGFCLLPAYNTTSNK